MSWPIFSSIDILFNSLSAHLRAADDGWREYALCGIPLSARVTLAPMTTLRAGPARPFKRRNNSRWVVTRITRRWGSFIIWMLSFINQSDFGRSQLADGIRVWSPGKHAGAQSHHA